MKRMTECRGDNLRKGRAQGTGLFCRPVRSHLQLDVVRAGEMAEFMNHGTLLRRQEQQQEAQGFEQLSHSNGYRPFAQSVCNANR